MKFRDKYYFLSNMFPCTVTVDMDAIAVPGALQADTGRNMMTFPCSESAFQAAKCANPKDMLQFQRMDGFAAKRAGRKVTLRPDWETVKITVMANVVKAKFDQHDNIRKRLCGTTGEICEDNAWNDTFWGKCNGRGSNNLGMILMGIRDGYLAK